MDAHGVAVVGRILRESTQKALYHVQNCHCSYLGGIGSIVCVQGAEGPVHECICGLRIWENLRWGIKVPSKEIEGAIGGHIVGEANLVGLRRKSVNGQPNL